jgi:hypothetical protein
MVKFLTMITERFDKNPPLLRLFTNTKTLKTLLSSLLILSESLSLEIVDILFKIFTHSSGVPFEMLEMSCADIWP